MPSRERRPLGPERAQQQRAEHRELGHVRQLAEDEIPRAEARAEVGNRREGEDDGRPENDRRPEAQRGGGRHGAMVGSPRTNGAR